VPELAGVALRVVRLVDAAEPPVHAGRGEQLSEGKPNAARSGEHVEDANLSLVRRRQLCERVDSVLAERSIRTARPRATALVVARRILCRLRPPFALAVATRRPIHLDPVTEPIVPRRVGRIGVELTERRIVTLRDLDTDERRRRPPDNFGADLRRRRRTGLGRAGPVPDPVGRILQFERATAERTRAAVALGNINVDHSRPPVD